MYMETRFTFNFLNNTILYISTYDIELYNEL